MTEQLPVDERHLYPESYLLDSLAIRLGGRASEILVLGEASTGASNDLAGATELAIQMVRDWGLSPRLGPIGYGTDGAGLPGRPAAGPERPYAEGTQQVIDEEVSRLLREAEERARAPDREPGRPRRPHRRLLEKETIAGEELTEVVNRVRGTADGKPAGVVTPS